MTRRRLQHAKQIVPLRPILFEVSDSDPQRPMGPWAVTFPGPTFFFPTRGEAEAYMAANPYNTSDRCHLCQHPAHGPKLCWCSCQWVERAR